MGVFILVWIALGIVAAFIGGAKGGSVIGWFIVGVIFGPLAWLFALMMAPVNNVQSQSGSQDALNERQCPKCAEMIKREAVICKHCKCDVEPLSEYIANPEYMQCPKCETKFEKHCSYCNDCDVDLEPKI